VTINPWIQLIGTILERLLLKQMERYQ